MASACLSFGTPEVLETSRIHVLWCASRGLLKHASVNVWSHTKLGLSQFVLLLCYDKPWLTHQHVMPSSEIRSVQQVDNGEMASQLNVMSCKFHKYVVHCLSACFQRGFADSYTVQSPVDSQEGAYLCVSVIQM